MNLSSIITRSFFFIIVISCYSTSVFSQSSSDDEAIQQVIDNYVVGWRTADTVLLSQAFDLNAGVVLWVDRKSNPERLNSMTLKALIGRMKKQEGYGINYTIGELKVIDSQLAIAMVKIPSKKGHYIDTLELQKINSQWKIVLKSFVYFPDA
ncbi:MAG: nuclear transport factor 2 family protein [Cytophagales bacterium]|nr:nuclear transport factor 2 family protein [Cytophagales bacterium]